MELTPFAGTQVPLDKLSVEIEFSLLSVTLCLNDFNLQQSFL
jgi:hypothetical protein